MKAWSDGTALPRRFDYRCTSCEFEHTVEVTYARERTLQCPGCGGLTNHEILCTGSVDNGYQWKRPESRPGQATHIIGRN